MPSGELNITLSDLSLASTLTASGTVLHAILGNATLSSTCTVQAVASLNATLEAASLSGETAVKITGVLSQTLGELKATSFGRVYTGIDSPYEDVISWTGHPLTGSRVRVRTGNLHGIFGVDSEFGIYAGDGWDADSGAPPTVSSQYIRLGNYTNEFHNVPIKLYDGANVTMQMEPTAPSFAMGSTLPTGYATGVGLWQGKDTDDIYKWRIGDPSGASLNWDGTSLSLNDASLDISGLNVHIALGNPPPTASDTGTGIWMDNTGIYGLNNDVKQVYIDTTTGILYSGAGTVRIDADGANIIIGTYNEHNDLTGVELNSTGLYGKIDDVVQIAMRTDGKLIAGAGNVIIDAIGIKIIEGAQTTFLAGNLNGEYGVTADTQGLGLGSYADSQYMTYFENALSITGNVNAVSGTLNELDIDGVLSINSDGKIQLGDIAESNIIIESDRLIGYVGAAQDIGFILGNLSPYYGESSEAWGIGIGSSDVTGQYLKFSNNTLTVKAIINSGNGNVFIDETGLYITPDISSPDYTSIIRYENPNVSGVSSVFDAYISATEITSRLYSSAEGETVSSKLLLSSVSGLDSTTKISAVFNEDGTGITGTNSVPISASIQLTAQSTGTTAAVEADSVIIDSTDVTINGGAISVTPVANGIPQANALGKIDASWIPDEEEETGTFEIPTGAMFLWVASETLPANTSYVDSLDGYFTMGASATDLVSTYGDEEHAHTNPGLVSGGGHNNHVASISGSSQATGTAAYNFADKAWIVGTHSHTSGNGSNQSTAGAHDHSGGVADTAVASNIPKSYRGLRWVRATSDIDAPVGAIIMEVAGADLGDDWAICNGGGSTPNLTDYFIYPSTATTPTGSNTHSHTTNSTASEAGHTHTIDVTSSVADYTGSSEYGNSGASGTHTHNKSGATSETSAAHTHTVSNTSTDTNMPPYFVVRFWQRINDENDAAFPPGVTFGIYEGVSLPAGYREFAEGRGYIPKGVTGSEIIGSRHGVSGGATHAHSAGTIGTSAPHSHGTTSAITYSTTSSASRLWAAGAGTTRIGTHNHTFTFSLSEIAGHTHSLASANVSAEIALPPYKEVMFIVKNVGTAPEIPQAVFLTTPLTSTSWDGDTKTTSDRATIDLSAAFGVPAAIKAVIMSVQTQGDAANDYVRFGPGSTYSYALTCRTTVAGVIAHAYGVVPCDTNGDIYCYPSGTVESVYVWIWGYFL